MPDRDPLTCHTTREWLSAYRDAEAPDDPVSRGHLEACAACGTWSARLRQVTRAVAASHASTPPDVVGPALAAWTSREEARSGRRGRVGRLVLAFAGVSGIVLTVAALVILPTSTDHALRDQFGFQLAFCLGFLLCSRDPRRYGRAMLPLAAAASVIVLLPSAAETAANDLELLAEASHLPILLGLFGLVLVMDSFRRGTRGRSGTRGSLGTVSA